MSRDKGWLIAGATVFGLLLLWKGVPKLAQYVLRNLRNHNPGNMRISDTAWKGKVPVPQNTDGAFEQFQDMDGQPADFWGLRANMVNVLSKVEQGATTLRKLGDLWAPASDNKGDDQYGVRLANTLNTNPDETFDIPSNLGIVMHAITLNEGSIDPYSDEIIAAAATDALQTKGYV